jgi:putative ABC transport system permease protein
MKKIPHIAELLLQSLTLYNDQYSALEDFEETYNEILESEGIFRAKQWCYVSVLKSFMVYIHLTLGRSMIMFKNYIKLAFRNIRRNKGFSFINIFGLAVGITCFICIMMYVKYELGYDSFHEKNDRIFRIVQHWEGWNFRGSSDFASTNGAMANVLPDEFQEIEYAVRIKNVSSSLRFEQNSMVEDGIYADKDFFNTFTFPLISGDRNTALQDPFSIVLTRELAGKLFGQEDPIGKVLTGFKGFTFNVTGVCEKIPDNSHLQFDFIVSFQTMYSERDDIDAEWGILNYFNYVLLKENVQYKEFEKKLTLLVDKYHEPEEDLRYYFLQPVTDIHLDSHINSHIANTSDRKYIYLFTTIAFMILIIASVNYVNLATSRASLRGKEVGIRKAVGALRSELMKQFLGESIIFTILAFIFSIFFVFIIHPYFKAFVNQDISLGILFNPVNIAGLIGLIIVVGFVSGCYPSFLLSSFKSANILKAGKTRDHFGLRNILVVFQFLVSIILIVGTLVIYKQLNFIRNKDIGFNRENVINIKLWNQQNVDKFELIKEELIKHNNIISASISDRAPTRASENNTVSVESENSGEMVDLPQTCHFYVDHDFIDLYGMRIKEGRGFSRAYTTDPTQAVVVNETLVKKLGLENPVGKRISASNRRDAIIIGVAEDFHYASFTYKIGPAVFVYRPLWAVRVMSIKISNGDIQSTLGFIETAFNKHVDDFVFNYSFLDESLNDLYNSETRMGALFVLFSIIAVSIASFGLFGLISSIAAQKTKEIGIRKVLGASEFMLIKMLSWKFLKLVLVSNIIALPIAYYSMNKWLQNFEYRIDQGVWIYILSGFLALIIALLTVSFQAIRAAHANPVNSLRYE